MRGDKGGDPLIATDRQKLIEDMTRSLGIEVAGGLVGQQQMRTIGQRAGDGDALLLATGEFGRTMVGAGREAHTVQ